MDLEFSWRYKDYGLKAVPPNLVKLSEDDKNETIDFVKYYKDKKNKEFNITIGYFYRDPLEKCWEFKFVGSRFMEIDTEDIKPIWEVLKTSFKILNDYYLEKYDN